MVRMITGQYCGYYSCFWRLWLFQEERRWDYREGTRKGDICSSWTRHNCYSVSSLTFTDCWFCSKRLSKISPQIAADRTNYKSQHLSIWLGIMSSGPSKMHASCSHLFYHLALYVFLWFPSVCMLDIGWNWLFIPCSSLVAVSFSLCCCRMRCYF